MFDPTVLSRTMLLLCAPISGTREDLPAGRREREREA